MNQVAANSGRGLAGLGGWIAFEACGTDRALWTCSTNRTYWTNRTCRANRAYL
jgi:hypothetical protein